VACHDCCEGQQDEDAAADQVDEEGAQDSPQGAPSLSDSDYS
jgi:hypothetical protein